MFNQPNTIRLQADGVRHRIKKPLEDGLWLTICGLKVIFHTVGKVEPKPPKTDCGVCYD